MTKSARALIRFAVSRTTVAALALGVFCAVAGQDGLAASGASQHRVIETAAIEQSPTSIGSADSDLYYESQADVDRTLDTLQAMGVRNVRIIVPWAGVQPANLPFYNWGNVDRMVEAAEKRGMGVLAVLNSTPAWAADRYLSGHPTPEAFAGFARVVADRYQGKIAAYEVWNEPNGLLFWNPVDPAAYTRMLQAGYSAIKDADPDALVVGGVVASLFSAGNITLNPQDFIAAMYDNGAKGYFDAISFHPYHYQLEFSESGLHPAGALNQLQQMRDIMIANGDGDLKIWASEYGLPTARLATGEVITEEHQARFIEDFLRSWQEAEGTGPVFIYTTRDALSGDPDVQNNFGFFYTDWTPKQAAYVIAQFAGGLPPDEPDRPILDAITAIAEAIADAAVWLINAGIDLLVAAAEATVRVIGGLIDLGVRVVRGLANATVAVISGIVDAVECVVDGIRDRLDPEEPAVTRIHDTARVQQDAPALEADDTAVPASVNAVDEADGGTGEPSAAAVSEKTEAHEPDTVGDEAKLNDEPDATDADSTDAEFTDIREPGADTDEPDATEPDENTEPSTSSAPTGDAERPEADTESTEDTGDDDQDAAA